LFLASLWAGWISIMPFALMQYSLPHWSGLISISDLFSMGFNTGQWIYYGILLVIMLGFGIVHLVLTVIFLKQLFPRLKTENAKEYIANPIKNAWILTPLLSLAMTMNFLIWTVRFFIPWFANHLQDVMLPALIFRLILAWFTLFLEINLLKKSFVKWFDVDKINFGWLLHPFTIGMVAVVGSGIAALAKNPQIANVAAFFTFTLAWMWFFLFIVKLITLFKKHFASKEWLGDKQFMPSFLIVIPNLTLYGIIAFRLIHYMGIQLWAHVEWLSFTIIIWFFTFSSRYMLFGLKLMKQYFEEHFFKKDYYVTLRGLICPFVAYAVLGSFAYKQFFNSSAIYALIVLFMILAVSTYIFIWIRQLKCISKTKNDIICE